MFPKLCFPEKLINMKIESYWNVKKEKFKQKYPILTNEDLQIREGKEKEMIELLGYKLGKSKDELRNIIEGL